MRYNQLLKNRKGSQSYTIIIAIVLLLVIGGGAYYMLSNPATTPDETHDTQDTQDTSTTPSEPESTIPDFEITLVGPDGTTMTIGPDDITDMTVIEMDGGLLTSAGSINGPYKYTGVALDDVLSLVGGSTEENSIRITASDGYAMVYTWDELEGGFLTFSPTTGDEVEATKGLTAVLAYYEDDEPLPEGHGPIRLVVLGEEGLITEGHYWVKQVVKIEVIKAVQEYTLTLTGAISEIMDRATFESGTKCPDTTPVHQAAYEDEDGNIYTGIPLWLLVGQVDDEIDHGAGGYNRVLAEANAYMVQVIANDGFIVELNSSFVDQNQNILLANEMNGAALPEKYWPLKLVGSDLTKGQMARNIVEVKLVFNETTVEEIEASTADIPEFELTLVGAITETMDKDTYLSAATCDAMQHVYTWTDSTGTEWTGIPVWLLVGRVDDDNPHGADAFNRELAETGYQVSFIANDGYHKELDSSLIAENNQILVAYLANGDALPEDKAPLRLVGEGLTTGQMVSMLDSIEIIFP